MAYPFISLIVERPVRTFDGSGAVFSIVLREEHAHVGVEGHDFVLVISTFVSDLPLVLACVAVDRDFWAPASRHDLRVVVVVELSLFLG